MRIGRSTSPAGKTQVVVLTADSDFERQARATFGASDQIALRVASGSLAALNGSFDVEGATVAVVDLDAGRPDEMRALEQLMARVADFLVKPVSPVELVRTCARVATGPAAAEATEAQIYTFLPAVGGAGVTTLAVQSAMMLLNSGQR